MIFRKSSHGTQKRDADDQRYACELAVTFLHRILLTVWRKQHVLPRNLQWTANQLSFSLFRFEGLRWPVGEDREAMCAYTKARVGPQQ